MVAVGDNSYYFQVFDEEILACVLEKSEIDTDSISLSA